jgi:hypothetical protein
VSRTIRNESDKLRFELCASGSWDLCELLWGLWLSGYYGGKAIRVNFQGQRRAKWAVGILSAGSRAMISGTAARMFRFHSSGTTRSGTSGCCCLSRVLPPAVDSNAVDSTDVAFASTGSAAFAVRFAVLFASPPVGSVFEYLWMEIWWMILECMRVG